MPRNGDKTTRKEILDVMIKHLSPEERAPLMDQLFDTICVHSHTHWLTFNAFGELSPAERAPYMRRFCEDVLVHADTKWRTRRLACQVLISCTPEERAPFMPMLGSMLAHEDWAARAEAVQVMKAITPAEYAQYLPACSTLLHDEELDVRSSALNAFSHGNTKFSNESIMPYTDAIASCSTGNCRCGRPLVQWKCSIHGGCVTSRCDDCGQVEYAHNCPSPYDGP